MTTKEELKELLKGKFEECSEEEATDYSGGLYKDFIAITIDDMNEICFKPVEQFPIIFEGDNFKFDVYENKKIICKHQLGFPFEFTDKDIQANKDALKKLEELRNGK